jgi:hypothetical protein
MKETQGRGVAWWGRDGKVYNNNLINNQNGLELITSPAPPTHRQRALARNPTPSMRPQKSPAWTLQTLQERPHQRTHRAVPADPPGRSLPTIPAVLPIQDAAVGHLGHQVLLGDEVRDLLRMQGGSQGLSLAHALPAQCH